MACVLTAYTTWMSALIHSRGPFSAEVDAGTNWMTDERRRSGSFLTSDKSLHSSAVEPFRCWQKRDCQHSNKPGRDVERTHGIVEVARG